MLFYLFTHRSFNLTMEISMRLKKLIIFLLTLVLISCDTGDSSSSGTNTVTMLGYSISGRIAVSSNTAVDGDVNDPNAPYTSNDDPTHAQTIPNPVIIGGYVNLPGKGHSGRSATRGDQNDFFVVDLDADQTITLYTAQPDFNSRGIVQNDLDLRLLNSSQRIVGDSVNDVYDTEVLIAPTDGRYFIQVYATAGASNYILSIGQSLGTSSVANTLNASSEFVPGEVLVRVEKKTGFSAQSQMGALSALGLDTQGQDPDLRMKVALPKPQFSALATNTFQCETDELCEKIETLQQIKELRQQGVEAELNYLYKAFRIPNDPFFRYQWNYNLMNLSGAWDITRGSSNVVVAVIDTGVLTNHPDLKGKLVNGYDFISDSNTALDGNGIDSDPSDPGDQIGGKNNSSFHGTHVSGTIAAMTDNNEGIAGVGWLTKVMPLRVLGRGGDGSDYDIEQAILYAAGLPNRSGTVPAKAADVINMSLGGPAISSGLQQAIIQAYNKGIVIVSAAGNSNSSAPMYPASLPEAISVSAVDINKKRASYSNYGSKISLAAPGGDKLTADVNGDGQPDEILSSLGSDKTGAIEHIYAYAMGTSMATPHVSGVIALMKAVNANLTPQNVDQLIKNGSITEDIGDKGRDNDFGYGLLNAQKAVTAASNLSNHPVVEVNTPAELVTSVTSINFGVVDTSRSINLSNGGGNSGLQIRNISEDSGGFLSISSTTAVDADGLGTYIVTVNRNRLSQGTYSATITVVSSANTVKIPIILQVTNTKLTGDAGYHYVLIIDPATEDTVEDSGVGIAGGYYNYNVYGLEKGSYIVVAGSDFNNDGYVCDAGESCGAYLTLSRPDTVSITNSVNDVNFNAGFNVNFTAQMLSDEVNPSTRGYARSTTMHNLPH